MANDPSSVPETSAERPGRSRQIVLGLIVAPGLQDLAEWVAHRLPDALRDRFPEASWKIVVRIEPLAGSAGMGLDLVQLGRRLMLDAGWQLAVCLTTLPLKVGRRPVTAHASSVLGVGVVSVPAVGAFAIQQRVLQVVLRTIEVLLSKDGERKRAQPGERRAWMRSRLDEIRELSSPAGRAFVPEEGTVRFATATARGNLRLLVGAIRGNRPWRLVLCLSRSLVAALGTAAFGLTSPAIWRIADAMPWPRALALTIGSLLAMAFTLIAAHGLWERAPSPETRARVVLTNIATAFTVAIGVLTPYLVLFVINAVFGRILVVSGVLAAEVHHAVGSAEYLRIAWVVSSLATFGGALGAALESNVAVREATYCVSATEPRGRDRVGG